MWHATRPLLETRSSDGRAGRGRCADRWPTLAAFHFPTCARRRVLHE